MKLSLLFLLLFVPAICFSQSNFKKGYVITSSNDSLPGFIDYQERSRNPATVVFKATLNADPKTYSLSESKAYTVEGYESYERFTVDISMGEVTLSRLAYALDTSSREGTVFLKVLQSGKNATLYSYADNVKTRFYIRDHDSTRPVELLLAMYLSPEGGAVQTHGRYVSQLRSASRKYGNTDENDLARLKRTRYTKNDLLQVVSTINGRQFEKVRTPVRFFLGAGLDVSRGTYSGETAFNEQGAARKQSYSPMLTMGIDLFANPHVGKFIYRAELSFVMSNSEITAFNPDAFTEYKKHSFDSYGVILTPRVIYNFYNSKPVKIYAGAGFAMNYLQYKNNVSTTQYSTITRELKIEKDKIQLNKLYFAPSLSAGVVLKKKVELFGNYYFTSAISDYTMYNVCLSRTDIGLRYLFGNF